MSFSCLHTGFVFSSSCKNTTGFLGEVQNKIKTMFAILQSYSKWHLGVNRGDGCKL